MPRVRAIVYYGFFARLTRVPALVLIGFWFVYQLAFAFLDVEEGSLFRSHRRVLSRASGRIHDTRRREPAPSDHLRM